MVALDLTTLYFPDPARTGLVAGKLSGIGTSTRYHEVMIPTLFEATKTYEFQIDFEGAGAGSEIAMYSMRSPDLAGYDNSEWYYFQRDLAMTGTGTLTFKVGPTIEQFDFASTATPPEPYGLLEFYDIAYNVLKISAIRVTEVPGAEPPPTIRPADSWKAPAFLPLGVSSTPTALTGFTLEADEPPAPAGYTKSGWFALPVVVVGTWCEQATGSGLSQLWWRDGDQWVREELTWRAVPGRQYYLRVMQTAAQSQTVYAKCSVRATPYLGFNFSSFGGPYPVPGATRASAPEVVPGSSVKDANGSSFAWTLPGTYDPTYATDRTESQFLMGGSVLKEGWWKFTAATTGMVRIGATRGYLSVWDGEELVGARYNSSTVNLIVDVEAGKTYHARLAWNNNSSFFNFSITKISAVVHTWGPIQSPALEAVSGRTTQGTFDGSVYTAPWDGDLGSYAGQYTRALQFMLPAMPPPAGASADFVADARFITDGHSSHAPVDDLSASSPAFAFTTGSGSFSWYWPMDTRWQRTTRHLRWISLRDVNLNFATPIANIIAGTIGSQNGNGTLELSRFHYQRPGEVYTVYAATTGIRVSWFIDEVDEPPPAPTGRPDNVRRRFA